MDSKIYIEVLSKLAAARLFIRAKKHKPDASNTFSNYNYFSPEIVSKLVNDACIETNAICVFNLKKDEYGFLGELTFTDLETGEGMTTIMRTERPSIKATNETQQMGGMQTYTKRYCLMSLFDIEDNSIDFDSQDFTKEEKKAALNELPWLNEGAPEFAGAVEKMKAGKSSIEALKKFFKISQQIQEKLLTASKQ